MAHASFDPGQPVRIRSTGRAATVVAQSGASVLIRNERGLQWTYLAHELQPADAPVCELPA